jgi:NADP-dependent 3-hydroxy acid dehydrogenase YdfG
MFVPLSFQSISPGLVDTELLRIGTKKSFNSDELFARVPSLEPRDIADAVAYVLAAPPHVQVATCPLS